MKLLNSCKIFTELALFVNQLQLQTWLFLLVNQLSIDALTDLLVQPTPLLDISNTSSVTVSNEFIEEAELLLSAGPDSSSVLAGASDAAVFDDTVLHHLSWPCTSLSPLARTNSDSCLQRLRRQPCYGSVSHADAAASSGLVGDNLADADGTGVAAAAGVDAPLETTTLHADKPSVESLSWQYYCDGELSALCNNFYVFFSGIELCLCFTWQYPFTVLTSYYCADFHCTGKSKKIQIKRYR